MYSLCILIYVSMYLYSYPSTHGISGLAAGGACEQFKVRLKITLEWTHWSTPRPWSSQFGDAIADLDWVNSEMHCGAVMEWVWRCAWRPRSSELRDALRGGDRGSLEMHLEAEVKWTQWCTLRPWTSESGDAFRDQGRVNSEMHCEAVIERVWRCTWRARLNGLRDALCGRDQTNLVTQLETEIDWTQRYTPRPWSSELGAALVAGYDRARLEEYMEVVDLEMVYGRHARCWDSNHRLVNSKPWKCDEVTLPLKRLWRTGWWRLIGWEVCRKLKLYLGVNKKSREWREDGQS